MLIQEQRVDQVTTMFGLMVGMIHQKLCLTVWEKYSATLLAVSKSGLFGHSVAAGVSSVVEDVIYNDHGPLAPIKIGQVAGDFYCADLLKFSDISTTCRPNTRHQKTYGRYIEKAATFLSAALIRTDATKRNRTGSTGSEILQFI